MSRVRIFLSVFALCAVSTSLFAQKFQNINDRFPMGLSEEILQDSYGFLWIGTVDGLVRFDGYKAIHYNHNPQDSFSISGNNLNSIFEDNNGFIWVGFSLDGANIFDRNRAEFRPICLTDPDGNCYDEISVNGFAQDENVIWIGTNKGLFAVSATGAHETLKHYVADSDDSLSISNTYITVVYLDRHNTLWTGTLNGVNKFDSNSEHFVNYQTDSTFPARQILDIAEGPDGVLWVSPRSGPIALFNWDEKLQIFNPRNDFPRSFGALSLDWDQQNNMWLCSKGLGAFRISADKSETFFFDPLHSDYHGYQNLYGRRVITGKYGNTWFVGGSVLKWPSTNKSTRSISSNASTIISVFADENYIWFNGKKPMSFNRNTFEFEKFWTTAMPVNLRSTTDIRSSLPRIYQYEKLDDELIIFVTTRNVYIWNKVSKVFQEYPYDSGGPFRDFALDHEDNVIWITPNQGNIVRFDINKRAFDRPDFLSSVKRTISVEMGSDGDIWFGSTSRGLYRFNKLTHEITNYSSRNENPGSRLGSIRVDDLCLDSDQKLWIGTPSGIDVLDTKTDSITHLSKKDGLVNDHITSILEDRDGKMWFGSYDGLSMYSQEENRFRHFDRSDGLVNANYMPQAKFKDENGILYFGGDNGVDFFDPSAMDINDIPPDVYLSDLSVNNISVNTGVAPENLRSIEFNYEQRIIEIELLALHLTAPMTNTYSYRISDISRDWIDLGTNRTITLANPNPGKYNIEVKAANGDGVWSNPKELIVITIYPPYWKTWWFITGCSLLGMALLLAIYRYRTQQVRKEEQLKAHFGKQMAEMEMKALRAQMNPHFLFNSLNSIKSLISAGENVKASEYVTRFSQLIRQVLSNSERSLVRLEEDLEALRLYLNIERLRFQNFEFNIDIEKDVNIDFIEVPPLLLQPYVENAIWHGLMHKTKGFKNINIYIKRDKDFLVMQVVDNGIGRERAKQIKMRGGSRKGGMGMRVTRDRIKLFQDYFGQDASVVVEDLKSTENGVSKATGTKVTIRIPVPE